MCTYSGRMDAGTSIDRERCQDTDERQRLVEHAERLINVQDELHSKDAESFICFINKNIIYKEKEKNQFCFCRMENANHYSYSINLGSVHLRPFTVHMGYTTVNLTNMIKHNSTQKPKMVIC